MVDLAQDILEKSLYIKDKLSKIDGIYVNENDCFQDIVISSTDLDFNEFNNYLRAKGIQGGIVLSTLSTNWENMYMITVNDFMDTTDIDTVVSCIEEFLND